MLNSTQDEIVKYQEGAILIIAGAGTGKTKTITERINRILSLNMCNNNEILCVTFTNKAAKELQSRIEYKMPWCGTFHGLACNLLRVFLQDDQIEGITKSFEIIDDYEQRKIISKLLKAAGSHETLSEQYAYKSYIASKNNKSESHEYNTHYEDFYWKYQQHLSSNNLCDFDSLIIHATKLIDASEHLQSKFKYIFIDEYQDINHNQYQMILSLAKHCSNICCVGDDDQSIYEWRGSRVEYIHKFQDDFQNVKVFKLETSYRCTNEILNAANNIIANNTRRFDKLLTSNKKLYSKNDIVINCYNNCAEEALGIVKKCITLQTTGKSVAVLCRTAMLIKLINRTFMMGGVPTIITRGKNILERSDVRIILAYLKTIADMYQGTSLELVFGTPKRGIGSKSVAKIAELLADGCGWSEIANNHMKPSQSLAMMDLIDQLDIFRGKGVDLILAIADYCEIEVISEIETLNDMLNGVNNNIGEFFEAIALDVGSGNESEPVNGNAVSIMTIHEAKGREFDVIFAPAWEEGVLPHSMSLNNIEEERRLAYVCITRAKESVFISYARSRAWFNGNEVRCSKSRFISEIA